MTEKQSDNLDRYLEKIITSPHARKAALASDNAILRTAAQLTSANHPVPSQDAKARMLRQVHQKTGMGQSRMLRPNFALAGLGRMAAVIVMILAIAVIGTAPVMARSLPGDTLYPVKRQLEKLERKIPPTRVGVAAANLRQAERRLREVSRLMDDGQFDAILIEDALVSIARANESLHNDDRLLHPEITERQNAALQTVGTHLQRVQDEGLAEAEVVAALFAGQERVAAGQPFDASTNDDSGDDDPAAESTESVVESTENAVVATEAIEEAESAEPTTEVTEPVVEPSEEVTEVVPESDDETATEAVEETQDAGENVFVVISDGAANIRSGPGTDNDVVEIVPSGSSVIVLSTTEGWMEVRLPNGQTGWIHADLVSETTNASGSNSTGQDFGCEGRGNSCNAPGQTRNDGNNGNGRGNGRGNNP